MDEKKKSNPLTRALDRIHHTNRRNYAPGAENSARLNYTEGNIEQNRENIADVWDTCPVLDEQGNPIKENDEAQ